MIVTVFNKKYPNGKNMEVDDVCYDVEQDVCCEQDTSTNNDDSSLNEFFNGLSTATTIAQIRELAKKFVNDTNK